MTRQPVSADVEPASVIAARQLAEEARQARRRPAAVRTRRVLPGVLPGGLRDPS